MTDTVTLIRGEDLGSQPYTPALYHDLKSISHLPLGAYSASIGLLENPTDKRWLDRIRMLLNQLNIAQTDLPKASFTDLQRVRQQNILSLSRAYLDDVLMRENADIASINLYSRTLAPLLLANAADAANVQIEALDQAVRELSKKLKPGEFEKRLRSLPARRRPARVIFSSSILYMHSVPAPLVQEYFTWKAFLIERRRWTFLERF